jgi:hypothetical protein
MERERVRAQSTLRTLGDGMIIFNLWNLLKPFLLSFFGQGETVEAADLPDFSALPELSEEMVFVLLMTALAYFVLNFVLRLYIGLSARAEGKGKRKGWLYLIVCVIIFAVDVILLITSAILNLAISVENSTYLQLFAALVLEISSIAILFETIVTSIKLKRLNRRARKEA